MIARIKPPKEEENSLGGVKWAVSGIPLPKLLADTVSSTQKRPKLVKVDVPLTVRPSLSTPRYPEVIFMEKLFKWGI